MFKKTLCAIALVAAANNVLANKLDDEFLEKLRFIQYHAPHPADYRQATQRLIQSVNQSDGQMLGALGRALMRTKDYDTALGVLISTVRIAPSNAEAQADLAFVSARVGPNCPMSREAYARAVALDATLAKLWTMEQAKAFCQS